MAGINTDRFHKHYGAPWWTRCFATMTTTLVTVNVLVFLVVGALTAVAKLPVVQYVALLGPVGRWIYSPWGLLTYMFVQTDLLHLLFNMIWLWGFGMLMERFDGRRCLLLTYAAGGIGGGVCYLVVTTMGGPGTLSMLVGSSASVMGVIAGAAARQPRIRVGLVLFGNVELRVLALIAIVLLGVVPGIGNIPTLAAHIGGALAGWLWVAWRYRSADRWKTPKVSKTSKAPMSRVRQHQRRGLNEEQQREMDELLAKVKQSGYKSLTTAEKQRLFKISSYIK